MATLTINVPDELVPRLMAALRTQYPDLCTGKTDGPAGRAVIAHLLRGAMKHHAGQQARQERQDSVNTAEQKAWTDTEVIS